MTRKYEVPMTREVDSPISDTVTTHPAFASIKAGRVQGRAALYGSEFEHIHYVTIKICKSEVHRGLSNDHYYSEIRPLIEVAMSEAQWASFVSGVSLGNDVPCTLEYIDGKMVPGIELVTTVTETFKDEMHQTLKEIQSALKELSDDKRLPQWAKKEISMQAARLTNSTGFIAEQFSEHIENTVEKARIEINAHAVNIVQRTGIAALQGETPPITLPKKDKS